MTRETTPDDRRMARSATASDAAAVASGLSSGNARLRRGSNSFDDRRNSLSGSTTGTAAAHLSAANLSTYTSANGSPAAFRRRSSNFSDYSQEARDLLNPRPLGHGVTSAEALRHHQPTSSWDSLPLAFALLPAVGGLLVQGGSSFVTDLMLLCLGGIFLHWGVTQPWTWYHSTQQIREEHEANAEFAVQSETNSEDDDDRDGVDDAAHPSTPILEDVQEEGADGDGDDGGRGSPISTAKTDKPTPASQKTHSLTPDERVAAYNKKQRERRQQERRSFRARQESALRELYRHEVLALLSCFASPIIGACLLHALRDQLSRPSEGLISNFNLTIFILGAEVRPLRHFLQLVQARTLHLQRIVHVNPYREEEERYRERREQEEKTQNQTLSDLIHRLDCLEQRAASTAGHPATTETSYFPPAEQHSSPPSPSASPRPPPQPPRYGSSHAHRSPSDVKRERDQLLREVRAQLQPELDTLARALRRSHKQQTLLEGQVAAKFRATDQRLSDAVSLAAAGGRSSFFSFLSAFSSSPSSSSSTWDTVSWLFDVALSMLLYLPRKATLIAAAIATFPLLALQAVIGAGGRARETSNSKKTNDVNSTRNGNRGSEGVAGKTALPTIVGGNIRTKKAPDANLPRDLEFDYATPPSRRQQRSIL